MSKIKELLNSSFVLEVITFFLVLISGFVIYFWKMYYLAAFLQIMAFISLSYDESVILVTENRKDKCIRFFLYALIVLVLATLAAASLL